MKVSLHKQMPIFDIWLHIAPWDGDLKRVRHPGSGHPGRKGELGEQCLYISQCPASQLKMSGILINNLGKQASFETNGSESAAGWHAAHSLRGTGTSGATCPESMGPEGEQRSYVNESLAKQVLMSKSLCALPPGADSSEIASWKTR